MTRARIAARAGVTILAVFVLFGCSNADDHAAPAASVGPVPTSAPPAPAVEADRAGDLPTVAGLNYARAQDVAAAFAAATLSYRWDTTIEQQYEALAPYATAEYLDGLAGAGSARTSAVWETFVAEHGVVQARVLDAQISPDAPAARATVFVQVTAVVVTTQDGRPEQSTDAALNVRLVWDGHVGWRVAQSTQI